MENIPTQLLTIFGQCSQCTCGSIIYTGVIANSYKVTFSFVAIPGLFIASAAVKRYSNNNSLFQNSGRRYLCTQTNAFGCVTCYMLKHMTTHMQTKQYMIRKEILHGPLQSTYKLQKTYSVTHRSKTFERTPLMEKELHSCISQLIIQ